MSVNSVSPNVNHTAPVQPQKQPASVKEVANDKGASTAPAQAAPRPTVNTNGQAVGNHINVKA